MDRNLLLKATCKEEQHTPGYLYREIGLMTAKGPDVSYKVAEFILGQLNSSSPVVRRKSLKIIKHLCQQGLVDFRLQIQRNIGPIKKCVEFSGSNDPLHGDYAYRSVREAANDALEAIFDESNDDAQYHDALATRIQGYAGDQGFKNTATSQVNTNRPYNTNFYDTRGEKSRSSMLGSYNHLSNNRSSKSPSYNPTSQIKYVGIGNPNFEDPRLTSKSFFDRVMDRVDEYAEKAANTKTGKSIQEWLESSEKKPSNFYRYSRRSPQVSHADNGSYGRL